MKTNLVNSLGRVKLKYYQYRYPDWYYGSIINKMENKMKKFPFKTPESIGPKSPYVNKPGIAFSFDDSFRVNQWYKYGKELFGYYDIKVTFNINGFHHFEGRREHTQEEIDMLLELQTNGHEIGHHGFRHKNADDYSREKGLSCWIEDEIKTLFDWLERQSHSITKEKFKKPVSYVFPFNEYNDGIIKELVPKHFKIVRGHLLNDNLIPFNHTGFAPSIGIDGNLLKDIKYVKKIMKMAKMTGNNVIFMCHSLIPDEIAWDDFGWGNESEEAGEWRISPNMIKSIIYEAKKMDLEFYTTSEIAGIATFIDRNLENCVRENIADQQASWITIEELSSITELDLRDKNISNLDGIQYFINLERLYLNDNPITEFGLLKRLPRLKELDIFPK